MINRRFRIVSLRVTALLVVLLLSVVPSIAAGRVVVFVTANVGARDILRPGLPNYRHLTEVGTVGLMNVRTAGQITSDKEASTGPFGMESACATIGAGTRARAGAAARESYSVSDRLAKGHVRDAYRILMQSDPPPGGIVNLGVQSLISTNSTLKYSVHIGALGDAVHKKGLRTAVIGNSDTPSSIHREASLICMDSLGRVDSGDIGSGMLRKKQSSPFGVETNTARLLRAFRTALTKSDLVVIDFGDTARADSYSQVCSRDRADIMREEAISGADRFLGSVIHELDLSKDLLLVISPNPPRPQAGEQEVVLTPVIAAGPGFLKGLLTSGSTHHQGIVAIADITSTISQHLKLQKDPSAVGMPMQSITSIEPVSMVKSLSIQTAKQASSLILMRGISIVLLVVMLIATLAVVMAKDIASRDRYSIIALFPPALFISVLWQPYLYEQSALTAAFRVGGLAIGIALAFRLIAKSSGRALAWMSALFCASIVWDMFRGGILLSQSLLSYTPSEGARYYGIGNELMGAFIGASVVAVALLVGPIRMKMHLSVAVGCIALALATALLGAPKLGANAGGAMAAGSGTLMTTLALSGRRIRLPEAVCAGAGALLVVVALLFIDSISGASQSHVGRAAQLVAGGAWMDFWMIAERKLAMNVMLLGSSAWSRTLICSACLALVLLQSNTLRIKESLKRNLSVRSAVIGVTGVTVAALVFNDSGVVAAAISSVYLWSLLMTVVNEKAEETSSPPPTWPEADL